MNEDRFSVFDGKEQQIDPKRTLRAKICPKWQPACTAAAAESFDRIFGEKKGPKSGRTIRRAAADDVLSKTNYRENFDRIFRAASARDESPTNGKER